MNWLQKYKALSSLHPVGMEIIVSIDDKTGNITYRARLGYVEIGGDGCLTGLCEWGDTPQNAIETLWETVSSIKEPKYLVVHIDGVRRQYRWDEIMWKEVHK